MTWLTLLKRNALLPLLPVQLNNLTFCAHAIRNSYYSGLLKKLLKNQGKAMVEQVYDVLVLIASARSQGSDEPARPRSLARAFAAVAIMKIVRLTHKTKY